MDKDFPGIDPFQAEIQVAGPQGVIQYHDVGGNVFHAKDANLFFHKQTLYPPT
jgi:hypothetical protein